MKQLQKENRERAKRAEQVLEFYGTLGGDAESPQDILSDLRHWCDWKKQDFARLDRIAHQHYLAELQGVD
jgi:hypothetical protein